MKGRRRSDTVIGKLPRNVKAGDYWRVLNTSKKIIKIVEPTNLTGEMWRVAVPMSYGYALATLTKHTVRENSDRTITVRPSDGSSNSILVTGHKGERWHGYIYDGVLESVE